MQAPLNLNRFDLVSLRLFVAIVEGGSLTVGAARFNISVAAASKRISELEAHVGSTLLTRSRKGAVPTPAGLTFLRNAIDIVARLEQLALAMGDFHRGAGGHLRLWANTSAFTGFLPRLLARYSAAHPSVMLDLEDAVSEDVVRAVARGNAELGIMAQNTPAEGLETLPCDSDELVLVMPAGHALAGKGAAGPALGGKGAGSHALSAKGKVEIEQVLEHDIIGLDRATSLMRQVAAAADARGRTLRVRMQVRGFDEVCRMVAAGLGVAILPRTSVAPQVKAMGLVIAALSGMNTDRQLLLVMRSRAALSAPARDFADLVESHCQAQATPAPRRPVRG